MVVEVRSLVTTAAVGSALLLAAVPAVAEPVPAVAEPRGVPTVAEARDFPVERFRWTFARTGVLAAEWGDVPAAGSWDVGLWLGTANDPLVLYRDEEDGSRTALTSLVAQRTSASLLVSYAPGHGLELGLELPLILAQSRADSPDGAAGMLASIAGAGLGDLRFAGKLGLLRAARHGVDLAVLASLVLPSGGGEDYRGERGVAVAPELAASRAFGASGETRLAAGAGYRARRNTRLLDLEVGDELYGVVAASHRLGLGARGVEASLGLSLATAAQSPLAADNQDYAELLAGATWAPPGPLVLALVGGAGLTQGFGAPDWRAVLAVRFGEVRARRAAAR